MAVRIFTFFAPQVFEFPPLNFPNMQIVVRNSERTDLKRLYREIIKHRENCKSPISALFAQANGDHNNQIRAKTYYKNRYSLINDSNSNP